MIKKNTVLILGAGASKPYDFPTGTELRNEIIALGTRLAANHTIGPFRDFLASKQIFNEDVKEFIHSFENSAQASIDSFLEKRQEYNKLGKYFIAHILFKCELNCLHKIPNSNSELGYWYHYFFQFLSGNEDTLKENKLKIITFNYDRSLETFLVNAFIHSFNISYERSIALLEHFEILHLYGKLSDEGRKPIIENKNNYDNFTSLELAAATINIIADERKSDPFSKAQRMINKADYIYMLGVGLDNTNLQRLGLNKGQKKVISSAYGVTKNQAENKRRLFRRIRYDSNMSNNCLGFLHDYYQEVPPNASRVSIVNCVGLQPNFDF